MKLSTYVTAGLVVCMAFILGMLLIGKSVLLSPDIQNLPSFGNISTLNSSYQSLSSDLSQVTLEQQNISQTNADTSSSDLFWSYTKQGFKAVMLIGQTINPIKNALGEVLTKMMVDPLIIITISLFIIICIIFAIIAFLKGTQP